jgi:hypothetical protein
VLSVAQNKSNSPSSVISISFDPLDSLLGLAQIALRIISSDQILVAANAKAATCQLNESNDASQ